MEMELEIVKKVYKVFHNLFSLCLIQLYYSIFFASGQVSFLQLLLTVHLLNHLHPCQDHWSRKCHMELRNPMFPRHFPFLKNLYIVISFKWQIISISNILSYYSKNCFGGNTNRTLSTHTCPLLVYKNILKYVVTPNSCWTGSSLCIFKWILCSSCQNINHPIIYFFFFF